MSESLLTENQRRHIATFLQVLTQDLAQLADTPELRDPAGTYRRMHDGLTSVTAAVRRIAQAFELSAQPPADVGRRVRAVALVWAARAADLRARRLGAYGEVHPDLAERLDPLVADLTRSLFALAEST